MMDKSKSLAQNIDQLFFAENAELKGEFDELYRALFKKIYRPYCRGYYLLPTRVLA